ncbi:tRNA uridine-5-carboxymethylaminomethyl(34) synthesis GTPase MnmE [bacterium DOLJORAL78_65_58]|nr:MAG: tRNA uridine-5-carboxymethylaminomethyl(34) synthesis GTPase MnmE [bacterium DOLZORAL124_64_63]PIE76122.1 MAG: tRNA uridine-5-carboxymethylaminomethyl(34) synthesis GTPase MnmE [bacterium DOLJORAL78_65_58]
MLNDTIVAIVTPEGTGGLGAVRLSGPGARDIAARVFHCSEGSLSTSHMAVYGILKDVNTKQGAFDDVNEAIDQVIALPMWAPRSYTGEDTVEFFCHGGTVVSRMVAAACRRAGARPATAGEFTRRAFLNGKLSLDQAEAVADLIHAESETAARAAVRQLLGGLDKQLTQVETPLLSLLARVEGGLEFLDDEVPEVPAEEVAAVLRAALEGIDALLAMAPAGRLLRDGIHVVLRGKPNVGKSSLFNRLVEEDRAIVDDEAGTTRDVVSQRVTRAGRVYVLHDTAGLREARGRVEARGIERTAEAARQADIILDLDSGPGPVGGKEVQESPGEAIVLKVRTKADLGDPAVPFGDAIPTSSVTGEGVQELWRRIADSVDRFALDRAVRLGVVMNERHRHKLESSRRELARLLAEYADEACAPGNDVAGTLLASILAQLGEISGRVYSEHLLESVFSRFCVGK